MSKLPRDLLKCVLTFCDEDKNDKVFKTVFKKKWDRDTLIAEYSFKAESAISCYYRGMREAFVDYYIENHLNLTQSPIEKFHKSFCKEYYDWDLKYGQDINEWLRIDYQKYYLK